MGKKRSKTTCKQRSAKAGAHHVKVTATARTSTLSSATASIAGGQGTGSRRDKHARKPWIGSNMKRTKSQCSPNNDEQRIFSKEMASLREREEATKQRQQQSNTNNKIVLHPATFKLEPETLQEKMGKVMSIGESERHSLGNGSLSLHSNNSLDMLRGSTQISGEKKTWWATQENNEDSKVDINPWAVLGTGDSSDEEENALATNGLRAAFPTQSPATARPLSFAPPMFQFGRPELSSMAQTTPGIATLSVGNTNHNYGIDPDL